MDRLRNVFHCMIQRCTNPNHPRFSDYGGRGIRVCEEWLEGGYEVFAQWALENGYQENLTIERKDNDGNYTPSNCTWATPKEQARNRRSNRILEHQGRRMPCSAWCEELGIKQQTLDSRLNRYGWSTARALTTPVDRSKRRRKDVEM